MSAGTATFLTWHSDLGIFLYRHAVYPIPPLSPITALFCGHFHRKGSKRTMSTTQTTSLATARTLMLGFADATGLSAAENPPRRYLWTDAFAVCNFLELFRRTGEERFRRLAADLIDQVHRILGRHRGDDHRTGWISGLGGREGYPIEGVAADLAPGKRLPVTARADDGATTAFEVVCRIDTPVELDYYKHGGILQFVLRQLASAE